MARFVLFDLVGTLLDEDSDHESLDRIMAQVRRRWSLEPTAKELAGQFALAVMEIIRAEPEIGEEAEFMPFHKAAPDVFAGLMATLGHEVSDADKAWFWDTYLGIQRKVWRPYKGVAETLEQLHDAGFILGAVTDADRYLIDDILPRTTLAGLLPVAVSAEESGFVKPHPASFMLAMQRAGVSAAETVVVGDSLERDVDGAHAAGIERAILFDRHDARLTDAPKIRRLSALPKVLREMDWWTTAREAT